MAKIYLRERREEIENQDTLNYNIDISFNKKDNNLEIGDNYNYRNDFRIGDIVTSNNNDFGYVYKFLTDDTEVKVCWAFNHSDWENKCDLLIVPIEYGLDLLTFTVKRNKCDYYPVKEWLALINGKLDNYNRECLFEDSDMPKVDFIKYDKDKNTLIDKKIDRNIKIYKDFNRYSLYKASVFNGQKLDSWKKVFYIYDKASGKVYFAGIDEEIRKTLAILFKRDKINFYNTTIINLQEEDIFKKETLKLDLDNVNKVDLTKINEFIAQYKDEYTVVSLHINKTYEDNSSFNLELNSKILPNILIFKDFLESGESLGYIHEYDVRFKSKLLELKLYMNDDKKDENIYLKIIV